MLLYVPIYKMINALTHTRRKRSQMTLRFRQGKKTFLQEMLRVGEPIMDRAVLEVKDVKCAVLYVRRSGNNWYCGKKDKKPCIEIQSKMLSVYSQFETYKYLGKSLSLSGEDAQQIDEFISSYVSLLHKIIISELPISLKGKN